jgi:hypothetical protein
VALPLKWPLVGVLLATKLLEEVAMGGAISLTASSRKPAPDPPVLPVVLHIYPAEQDMVSPLVFESGKSAVSGPIEPYVCTVLHREFPEFAFHAIR